MRLVIILLLLACCHPLALAAFTLLQTWRLLMP